MASVRTFLRLGLCAVFLISLMVALPACQQKEAPEEAQEAAQEVPEAAETMAPEVQEELEEVKEEAAEMMEEVKEEAAEMMEEVKEEAAEMVEEAKEEAAEMIEEAKEEAERPDDPLKDIEIEKFFEDYFDDGRRGRPSEVPEAPRSRTP